MLIIVGRGPPNALSAVVRPRSPTIEKAPSLKDFLRFFAFTIVRRSPSEFGTPSWVLRYQFEGRPHWMGLGPLALFGLKDAREKALEAKRLKHGGTDPLELRRQARAQKRLDAAKAVTFKQAAEKHIAAHKGRGRG